MKLQQKGIIFSSEVKTTKSNDMRIAAIKQKEDNREQKQNNGNYFLTKNKSYPYPPIDGKENNINKSKRNKKSIEFCSQTSQNSS